MQISKTHILEILSSIVKVNDTIVIRIFYSLENKVITKANYEKVIRNYRRKILRRLTQGKYQEYIPFFPILELFVNSDTDNIQNAVIPGQQHFAFSALKPGDKLPQEKKLGNRILWDLFNADQRKSDYRLKNYEKFLHYIKRDKDILKLIDSLGGTLSIEDFGNANFEEQRQNVLNVPDEFYSLTQSDDIRNIFYLELINLTEKELEIIFFKKIVDKNLLTYQLRKEQMVSVPNLLVPSDFERKKGALVVLIDNSGSMLGISEIISKYIAILISEICLPNKRNLILVAFSIDNFYMEINHYEPIYTIRQKIMQFLETSYYGGTNLDASLEVALEKISMREEFFYSDILIISDFLFKTPIMNSQTIEYYESFKKRSNRIIGLEISTANSRKRKIHSYLDEHYIYFFNWKNSVNLFDKFNADFLAENFYNDDQEIKVKFNGFLRKIYPLN